MARPVPDDQAFNQSPPFVDVNLFTSDTALREAVAREGAAWAHANLEAFGHLAGSAESLALGRLANEQPPRLKSFDPQGRRIDRVAFHPAYQARETKDA
jgi:putative acyl-CoA dehydrogenase